MINIFVILSLTLFYILFIGRTILLARQGVKVWVISSTKNSAGKILEALLVPFLIIWSVSVLLEALEQPILLLPYFWQNRAVQWLGIVLCFVGLLIFLAALISFGSAWRVGIDEQNSNRLVTGGIFSYSRNPIFLFMDIYFLGIFFIYPNLFFLLFFIGAAIGIHIQILKEEQFLSVKFGQEYERYKKGVRRYF